MPVAGMPCIVLSLFIACAIRVAQFDAYGSLSLVYGAAVARDHQARFAEERRGCDGCVVSTGLSPPRFGPARRGHSSLSSA